MEFILAGFMHRFGRTGPWCRSVGVLVGRVWHELGESERHSEPSNHWNSE